MERKKKEAKTEQILLSYDSYYKFLGEILPYSYTLPSKNGHIPDSTHSLWLHPPSTSTSTPILVIVHCSLFVSAMPVGRTRVLMHRWHGSTARPFDLMTLEVERFGHQNQNNQSADIHGKSPRPSPLIRRVFVKVINSADRRPRAHTVYHQLLLFFTVFVESCSVQS